MMRRSTAVLAILCALVPAGARAQEEEADADLPTLVQELFVAETVYPQEARAVQLTADARIEDGFTARLTAEYGITDRLQVSATTPYLQLEEGGDEEVGFGALYGVVNTPALAASVSLEAVIGTGGGASGVEWEPALIVARRVGAAQLHGSVAAGFSEENTELSPALGLILDTGRRLTPTLELAATMADGESPQVSLTPGVFLHLAPQLEIGVGAPLDVHDSPLPALLALVTLEF